MIVTQKNIQYHLTTCSNSFIPSLDSYVDIKDYSKKIFEQAILFTKFEKAAGGIRSANADMSSDKG